MSTPSNNSPTHAAERVEARSYRVEAKSYADAAPPATDPLHQLGIDFVRRVPAEPLVVLPPAPRIEIVDTPRVTTPWGDRATSSIGDFIEAYATWADRFEIPRAVHEAFAMQLIAALLNRSRVVIDCGGFKLTFDLWMAVLAGSGGGKNTARNAANPVIEAANIADLIDNRDWGSKEAFYQQLSGRTADMFSSSTQAKFYIWEEFSTVMKTLESYAFGGVKGWLTNRYDNLNLPEEIGYSDTGKSSNTPAITFDHAPRTNIMALSAPTWFLSNLVDTDATGGFLARWTIVDAPGRRSIHRTQPHDPAMVPRLAGALQDIRELRGSVKFFDGFWDYDPEAPYKKWYDATGDRFRAASPDKGEIFWNRHKNTVLKLAVIFEASMSRTLRVSPEAWLQAVKKAFELEGTLFRLFKTNMNSFGQKYQDALEIVRKAGPDGLPQSEFTRHYQEPKLRAALLQTMKDSEDVMLSSRDYSGRKGPMPVFLVHKDYFTAAS